MATADVVRDMGQTLVTTLQLGGILDVEPANVFVATPDEFEPLAARAASFPPTITVFLYHVTIAAGVRNASRQVLPNGAVTRPLLPLELHYLVTPWATNTADEHRMAGHVLQLLYDQAVLGAANLQGTSWMPGDSVQLTLASLKVEEQLQIWATTGAPYRLSLPYVARVIGLEPTALRVDAPMSDAG